MPEPKRAEFAFSSIQQLLHEKKYEHALVLLYERLDSLPADRTARLFLLLANVLVFGPVPFEKQIDDLRTHFDLTEMEGNIIRQIFLAAFQDAERTGQEHKQQFYQRLLRRQVLGQPLDVSIAEATASQFPAEANDTESSSEPSPLSVPLHPEWVCHPPPPPRPRVRRKRSLPILGLVTILLILLLGFYVATGRKNPLAQNQLTESGATTKTWHEPQTSTSQNLSGPLVVLPPSFNSAPWKELVSNQLGNLNEAYTRWTKEQRAPAGTLALKLNVEPSGEVVRVYEVVARLSDHRFIDAIIAEAKKWRLPHSSPETADVTIPLLFVAPEKETAMFEPRQVKTSVAARTVTALRPHTKYRLEASPAGESQRRTLPLAHLQPGDSISAESELAWTADQLKLESETWRPVKLRNEPKFAAETLEQVSSGTPVLVLQKERDWLHVKIKASGNIGYLRKEYVTALATAP